MNRLVYFLSGATLGAFCLLNPACSGDNASVSVPHDGAATDGTLGAGDPDGGPDPDSGLPVPTVGRLASGGWQSCAIDANDKLYCWGADDSRIAVAPRKVRPDLSWAFVSIGVDFACALEKSQARRYCWGSNDFGQLGRGTKTGAEGLGPSEAGWSQLSAGSQHACGIKQDGTLWCWGRNDSMAVTPEIIGDAGEVPREVLSPVQIAPPATWTAVAASAKHTCGIRSNGSLWCWGQGVYDITTEPKYLQIGTETDWVRLGGGDRHTCGIKQNGTLWCWGRNSEGQLGVGIQYSNIFRKPIRVGEDTDWAAVRGGNHHTCALKKDGALFCWGSNGVSEPDGTSGSEPAVGSLGVALSEETLFVLRPTRNAPDLRWADVAPAIGTITWPREASIGNHTCGLRRNGRVMCWGDGSLGQLGDPSSNAHRPLNQITSDTDWQRVGPGAWALKKDGTLWTWGVVLRAIAASEYEGREVWLARPTPQVLERDVSSSFGGRVDLAFDGASCFVKTNGALFCNVRRCEDPDKDRVLRCPIRHEQVGTETDWAMVTTGMARHDGMHRCAIKKNGSLWCWGGNLSGQIGDGTDARRVAPVPVAAGTTWSTVSAGYNHTCGVRMDGTAWCWGNNTSGQLGDGSPNREQHRPVRVGGDTDWATVAAQEWGTRALKKDGTLWSWGPTVTRSGDATWRKISDRTGSCGIRTDGSLWCDNTPMGQDKDWADVGSGPIYQERGNGCAIKTNGTLWCWGSPSGATAGLPLPWSHEPRLIQLP
ncbi:RCC1-like domain-containing protein [Pendulispora albinea]|uniref:Uncharacterized protein n=1 Tax=Pendulispora albinea TaxID=2741071 RepID=A0ABZ2MA22_9BACT